MLRALRVALAGQGGVVADGAAVLAGEAELLVVRAAVAKALAGAVALAARAGVKACNKGKKCVRSCHAY